MPERSPEFGSDLIVDLLEDLGIEHLAFNPGATFRGLHDSLVNYSRGVPGIVECLHEEISVAVAHGYAKATGGRMMGAVVHDVVGLQHAAMAVYNAWCDRAPVLVLGATGPMDASRRRPWIDWIHTANVQGNQVRDYTKWDDQPASLAAVPESLIRAVHLASSPPAGPVYVCFDSEVLEGNVPEPTPDPGISSFAAPAPFAPDAAALKKVAAWLLEAERPVVIADYVGRSQAALTGLVELAELLALPVVDRERDYNKVSLNFPTQHPLNLSGDHEGLVGSADLVLGIEPRDLFGALNDFDNAAKRPRPIVPEGARVVLVSVDHLATRSWTGDFQRLQPAGLHLPCPAGPFLEALLPVVRKLLSEEPKLGRGIEARREELTERSKAMRKRWRMEAGAEPGGGAITQAYLAAALDEATKSEYRVVANGHLDNWVHRLWTLERADQYLGDSGGGGLGYGLGASLGAALAHRSTGSLVIDIQSDGDALYTPSSLWTAARHHLPLIIVMDNNRAYNNSTEHAARIARARGRPLENARMGTSLDDPPVDFAGLARSLGVHGEGPVSTPEDLARALPRALELVRDRRQPVLLDVITPAREG